MIILVHTALDLVNEKKVKAILGILTHQEASLLQEFNNATKDIPIISIAPWPTTIPILPLQPPSFMHMGGDVTLRMQCLASIIGHFGWRKVIALYEHSTNLSPDLDLITHLSDALGLVDSVISHRVTFPRGISDKFVEEQLKKLRSKDIKVVVVLQSSFEFSKVLFEKAKKLKMMGKGYVWIVSDDIGSMLDSFDSSMIFNMQGAIGFKRDYDDTSEIFKNFKNVFRRKYRLEYPDEDEFANPSIHALLAYDATWVIGKAINSSRIGKTTWNMIDFEGLSGKIRFKNGVLLQNSIFRIINVSGKRYSELSIWSPKFGFSKNVNNNVEADGLTGDMDSIHWPGGAISTPNGTWRASGGGYYERPLRVGVPANGACKTFVNVTYDEKLNRTLIRGFSIDVFEAAVKKLGYYLPYEFVPYYGDYDEMVAELSPKVNRTLDAAVGDTEIVADRFEKVDFTLPYVDSGLVMVTTVKRDFKEDNTIVLKPFHITLWIVMISMSGSIGIIIWLAEHASGNEEFKGSFSENIPSMLWFSVTILAFAHRESIKNNLSRVLLSVWLFVVLVVAACFTAALTTMMAVPKLEPSVVDINYLQKTNAAVGCNVNSFIIGYLINVLQFKPENIRQIGSIHDYPKAFANGDISAAFFVVPHANVFLADQCRGYTKAGRVYKLGGFGFAFPKGSPLVNDISEAILKLAQSGKINQLLDIILTSDCLNESDIDGLTTRPFIYLFFVTGFLAMFLLLITIARLLQTHYWRNRRIFPWASLVLIECVSRFGLKFFREPFIVTRTNIARDHVQHQSVVNGGSTIIDDVYMQIVMKDMRKVL
ncbi:transmembrane signal receptor [Lithospermum erythrorhizon]|uniref:Transmembrane signal receptor n=1 Tax=Lithospermum erythrorhizon TaxID=34254 RepID=A0AAV3Q970_LITER